MGRRCSRPLDRPRHLLRLLLLPIALVGWPAAAPADTIASEPAPPMMYRIEWDGHEVPGITKISGLARHTETVSGRSGGSPSSPWLSPGTSGFEPLVLTRVLGSGPEFEQWANKVWNFGSGLGAEASLRDFRKDIRIVLFNALGQTVMAYNVYRCWPSDYQVIGPMEASLPSAPTEILVLRHEGWERDYTVVPPR
jgi:phage tail-like protein